MGARLKVDPEFKALGITQTDEERSLLLASLLKDGCRDYLILWKGHGVIVDGHTREEMCHEHKIPYKTREMPFKDRSEVVNWIIDNQLGRRNVNEEQKSYLRGKRYMEDKKPQGRPEIKGDTSSPLIGDTAERLAEKFGVSDTTIKRDAKFAAAVDALAKNVGPEIKAEILSGGSELSKKDVLDAAAAPPKQQTEAVRKARKTRTKRASKPREPKSGRQINDPRPWEKWDKNYGELKRLTDVVNRAMKVKTFVITEDGKEVTYKFADEIHKLLNEVFELAKNWKRTGYEPL